MASNNSPNYTGDVTIDSAHVNTRQQQSLGTGRITILPGGKLRFGGNISSEIPSFNFSNDIHLRGGELFGTDNDRQPRQWLGDLRVSDRSMIGEMNVVGTEFLEDGARLTIFGRVIRQLELANRVSSCGTMWPPARSERQFLQLVALPSCR